MKNIIRGIYLLRKDTKNIEYQRNVLNMDWTDYLSSLLDIFKSQRNNRNYRNTLRWQKTKCIPYSFPLFHLFLWDILFILPASYFQVPTKEKKYAESWAFAGKSISFISFISAGQIIQSSCCFFRSRRWHRNYRNTLIAVDNPVDAVIKNVLCIEIH